MKTATEIITILYEILNVDAITDLLSGGIHRWKRPEKNAAEHLTDIVVSPLTVMGSDDIVDTTPVNINIYAPSLSDNTVDETKLAEIVTNTIEALQAYSNGDNYFEIKIESQTPIFDEREQTFINLRVNIFHEQ